MEKSCLLLTSILFLMVLLESTLCVAAAPAIVVTDHGFAKQFSWVGDGNLLLVNRTSTFTQDDPYVYAFVKAIFYSANFTWEWYAPSDQLYYRQSVNASCYATPCSYLTWIGISGTEAAAKIGQWKLTFLADGTPLFSDTFWITATVTQDNYWDFSIGGSTSPQVNGSLRVVIHPSNLTWSYYSIRLPYAYNVTAYDYSTKQPLSVLRSSTDSTIVVSFGKSRGNGYSFVIKFDAPYIVTPLSGEDYVISWTEYPWWRYSDVHTVPEEYNVTLPTRATLLDVVGYNSMNLNYSTGGASGRSILIDANVTDENFGWSVLFRNLSTGSNANPTSTESQPPNSPLAIKPVPFLPVTISGASIWSAAISIFLLTASEFAPIYSKSGYTLLVNRKRLRLVAIILFIVFMITVAYNFTTQKPIPQH